jgi:hypothetical protein
VHELGRVRAALQEPRRDAARGLLPLGGPGRPRRGRGLRAGVPRARPDRRPPVRRRRGGRRRRPVGAGGDRAPRGPRDRDLFWAHTGGGGGTFGVVVAYTSRDLPAPPPTVHLATTTWQWNTLDAASFATLLRNYGGWLAANSAPDSPGCRLFGLLELSHVSAGTVTLLTQASGEDPALLDSFLGVLDDGMPAAALPTTTRRTTPWLQATQTLNGSGPNQRGKYKSAYMRRSFPDRHVAALHAALTDASYSNPQALVRVDTYGGRINAVAGADTAGPTPPRTRCTSPGSAAATPR